jgi:hypothetical protein
MAHMGQLNQVAEMARAAGLLSRRWRPRSAIGRRGPVDIGSAKTEQRDAAAKDGEQAEARTMRAAV